MQFNVKESKTEQLEKLLSSEVVLTMNGYEALLLSAVFLARSNNEDDRLKGLLSEWGALGDDSLTAVNAASTKAAKLHADLASVEGEIMKIVLGVK